MSQPDPETQQVFAQLGIELLESRIYSRGEGPVKKFSELGNEAIVAWFRLLGPQSPEPLVAEVRKRELFSEAELRLWLNNDAA